MFRVPGMAGRLLVVCSCILLSACVSDFAVYDSNGNPVKGYPVHVTEARVFTGLLTKHSKGQKCAATPFYKVQVLPVGDLVYVNSSRPFFSSGKTAIEFTESGAVKKINGESDPEIKESLEGLGSFLAKGLPAVGLGPSQAVDPTLVPCDTGPVLQGIQNIDDFK